MQTIKQCTKCGEWKHVSKFYTNPNTADNLTSWCKECTMSKTPAKKNISNIGTILEQNELLLKEVADLKLRISTLESLVKN